MKNLILASVVAMIMAGSAAQAESVICAANCVLSAKLVVSVFAVGDSVQSALAEIVTDCRKLNPGRTAYIATSFSAPTNLDNFRSAELDINKACK